MAFRFPLTKNPHELALDLRKVKTLNRTGDENAVATRSDTDFQELSRRYQDYFHSDQLTISSSLNSSVPPSSSIQFRLLSTSKGPNIISLDRKPPKINAKPPPVEDTSKEAKTHRRVARESAIEGSTILLDSLTLLPSKRSNQIVQNFRSDSVPTPIAIVRTSTAAEQTLQPAVPITQVWAHPSPSGASSESRRRRQYRRRMDFERLSPSFFRPPVPTGYALGYENSRPIYRSDPSYVPDRMKKGTLAGWQPPQERVVRKGSRDRKRRMK